jgi:hypothetical protein
MSVFHSYPADEQPEPRYATEAVIEACVRAARSQRAYERYATARTRWLDAKKRGHVLEISEATTAMSRAWKQTQRV